MSGGWCGVGWGSWGAQAGAAGWVELGWEGWDGVGRYLLGTSRGRMWMQRDGEGEEAKGAQARAVGVGEEGTVQQCASTYGSIIGT